MATWQFIVQLLPRQWMEIHPDIGDLSEDDGELNLSTAWVKFPPKHDLHQLFSKFLPRTKSWHENLQIWGNTESTDIQVWYEKDQLSDIQIRLDLRPNPVESIKMLIILAEQLDCVFYVNESSEIVNCNIDAVKHSLKKSNAYKYITDPKTFLENIEQVRNDIPLKNIN